MANTDEALLQGLKKVGLAAPPPGFGGAPQQNPQPNQGLEFDDVHLTSIFRLALDDDGVFRPQQTNNAAPQPIMREQFPPPQQQFMQQPMMPQFPSGFPQAPFQQMQQMPMSPQPQQMHFMQPGMPPSPGPHMVALPRGSPMPQMAFPPHQQPPFMPPRGFAGTQFPPRGGFAPQQPPESRDLRFNNYVRMKGREIGFIVRSQLRTVETGDDFADDFYFIQSEEKKRSTRMGYQYGAPSHIVDDVSNDERPAELLKVLKAIQNRNEGESGTMPIIHAPTGPLPELPSGRAAQQEAIDRKSKMSVTAATKWAGAKNVLGRSTKANLRTPRELIALQESILSDGDGEGKNGCFSGAGWKLRRVTMEVSDLLGEVKDLSRHLKARAAALPPGPATAGWEFFHQKLRELEQQQQDACERLAKAMGILDGDDAQLLSLLWLPKGRRTAIEAMKSLLNDHLLLLLEAAARMLVYFTCTSPDGKSSSAALEKEKYELDMQAANALSREYSKIDLLGATKCLRLFLESQTPESLRAVIATPGGALVSKSLLLHGQELSESTNDSELAAKWNEAFAVFISMAEEGITAKENAN